MEILSYLTNADYKIETKELFQRSKHSKLHSFLLVLHSGVFHLSLNCIEYNIVLFFCKKRTYIQMYLWNIIFHMWNMKKTNGLSWTDDVWISVSCLFFHTWCLVWYIWKSLVHVKWHSICEQQHLWQIEFFLRKNKDFSPAKTERYFLLQWMQVVSRHSLRTLLYPLTSLWRGPRKNHRRCITFIWPRSIQNSRLCRSDPCPFLLSPGPPPYHSPLHLQPTLFHQHIS